MKFGNNDILKFRLGNEAVRIYKGSELFLPTVTAKKVLSCLETNNKTKVIISGDVYCYQKVDCYSITFEPNSHLYMQPGSRLRIWEGGITNSDVETNTYISLCNDIANPSVKEDFSDMAELLIHPNVFSNRSPKVNLKLFTSGYKVGTNYKWQRMGFLNAVTFSSGYMHFGGRTQIQFINNNNDYSIMQGGDITQPFRHYTITSQSTELENAYIEYSCNIITTNYTITKYNNFIYPSNGYTAKLNLYKVVQNKSVEIKYTPISNENNWTLITSSRKYINPLVGFAMGNMSESSYILSYKDLVWDFSFELDAEEVASNTKEVASNTKGLRGTKSGGDDMTNGEQDSVDIKLAGEVFNDPKHNFESEMILK